MNQTAFYATIAALELIILASFFDIAGKSKRLLAPYARYILGIDIFMLGIRLCILVVRSLPVAYFLYSLFAVTHFFFYIALIEFMNGMSNHKTSDKTKIGLYLLGGLDIVLFVYGLFSHHVFDMNLVDNAWIITTKPPYFYHSALKLLLIAYIIYVSLNKMKNTYYIFWQKHILFTIVILVGIVIDVTHVGGVNMTKYPAEIIFGAGALVFFLTCVFQSKILRSHMYAEVFDSMAQYVFLYDNLGVCELANANAVKFFNLKEDNLYDIKWKLMDRINLSELQGKTEAEQLITYVKNDEIYYLRLDYKRLIHNDKFAGEIFGFTDVTADTIEFKDRSHKAQFDSFTNIFNYQHLVSEIEELIEKNPDTEYYVIGSDVRDFKVFNDVFGREAGDNVILKTAEVLKELHREGYLELFGRVYADRFGMLCKKDSFSENAIINKFLQIDHPINEEYYHLNIHFGVYRTKLEEGLTVKNMFDRAYVALDAIKNDVNVRLYHYNEVMRDEKVWEQTISSNIERALHEGQLRVVVQPQVDKDEHVIGGEALVRWRHPENGEISPGNFIPVLEKTGLVTNTDIYVWEECCKLLKKWKDLGHTEYYISVNISPTDFIFADIYKIFTNLVEKYDINPKNLKLEITETAMMTDVLERIVLIKRLEDYGFSVELDDFGSGYSSLNMLKEIPVDVIKMDMKFLYNYQNESTSNSRKIIGHIIQMAKDLNMQIVAEGVETEEQLGFLKESGCDVFQGYFFSKPKEVEDFEREQGIA